MCSSSNCSHMTSFGAVIARSASSESPTSPNPLYKGKIKSKNRQTHWTMRCSYCAMLVTNLTKHYDKARTTTEQSPTRRHYCGRSAHQGRGVGQPGVWEEEDARGLAPVRSAELLLSACLPVSFWGLAGLRLASRPSSRAWTNYSSDEWICLPSLSLPCGWHDRSRPP